MYNTLTVCLFYFVQFSHTIKLVLHKESAVAWINTETAIAQATRILARVFQQPISNTVNYLYICNEPQDRSRVTSMSNINKLKLLSLAFCMQT